MLPADSWPDRWAYINCHARASTCGRGRPKGIDLTVSRATSACRGKQRAYHSPAGSASPLHTRRPWQAAAWAAPVVAAVALVAVSRQAERAGAGARKVVAAAGVGRGTAVAEAARWAAAAARAAGLARWLLGGFSRQRSCRTLQVGDVEKQSYGWEATSRGWEAERNRHQALATSRTALPRPRQPADLPGSWPSWYRTTPCWHCRHKQGRLAPDSCWQWSTTTAGPGGRLGLFGPTVCLQGVCYRNRTCGTDPWCAAGADSRHMALGCGRYALPQIPSLYHPRGLSPAAHTAGR